MRLINTTSLEFKEFEGQEVPKYAILSHLWGPIDDEVSYKDYKKGRRTDKSGYKKIRQFCELARRDGFDYCWVDTSNIDKSSSSELGEAINSMFAWYRRSERCYAYLDDAGSDKHWQDSRWWRRGWTLQELIAPNSVVFYDQDWQGIGNKAELAREIEAVTGIPYLVLIEPNLYRHWTVAQKMSWAAGRQTTRVEDQAYSLLGLFGINMPLLYGEGEKAFERLQLAILQKFMDESIFAFQTENPGPHGILARRPDDFIDCSAMAPSGRPFGRENVQRLHPPRVSSWGIELSADAYELKPHKPFRVYGDIRDKMWAIVLTTAWDGQIRELPCTVVVVNTGPAPYTYRRIRCLHGSPEQSLRGLHDWCRVGHLERDKTFYLQFDSDF